MKVTDLSIEDWQAWLDKFRKAKPNAKPGAAMRIENTPMSIARHYGGLTMNGDKFTYFQPVSAKPPFVAWLIVREDCLRWIDGELRKESRKEKKQAEQPSLL